jgi:hypothetical protein
MMTKLEEKGNAVSNRAKKTLGPFLTGGTLLFLLPVPFSFISCTEVHVSLTHTLDASGYQPDVENSSVIGGDHQPSSDSSIGAVPELLQPGHDLMSQSLCQLDPPVSTVRKQENSAWCWASSTQLVIEHLEQRKIEQCAVVQTALTDERGEFERQHAAEDLHVDCCTVTDKALETADRSNKDVQASMTVCHRTYRPEWALAAHGYGDKFSLLRYDPSSTAPQGLGWDDLRRQVCANRPFISVKRWIEGGTHSEVVTGYRSNPDAEVEMDTHGMDTFYVIPYMDYLGKPGESIHVRDYVNIGE